MTLPVRRENVRRTLSLDIDWYSTLGYPFYNLYLLKILSYEGVFNSGQPYGKQ